MKEIIAVINQKGGVGKTTTAENIGAGLILKGYKVFFIDLDAQGNLSYSLGASTSGLAGCSTMDVLTGRTTLKDAIQQTEQASVVASSSALIGADTVLTAIGKEYRLKEALAPLQEVFDYVVIDTPPALGILTVNALAACTGCIVPAQADIFSLQGINQLYDTIETVKKYCNPVLRVMGILITRFTPRAIISREVAEKIEDTAKQFNTKVYTAKIRECIALKEAQAMKTNIFAYAPKSNAAADYRALIDEILKAKKRG